MSIHGVDFFAVPNGAHTSAQEKSKLKAEGLVRGVPDLVITTPPPWQPGVVIVTLEMKRRNGQLSDVQKEWMSGHEKLNGWLLIVGYGAQDAIHKLRELGYGC